MKDQVSFGSQLQYWVHASRAQIAPQMIANVQIGNANACTRKVSRSSPCASGNLSPSEYGKRRLPPSNPALISVNDAATNPISRIPEATEAAVTWIFSQYELSAGISGPAFVYSRMPASPSMTIRASVTYRPRCRAIGRRYTSTSHAVAPTKHAATTNSYMLPHGT